MINSFIPQTFAEGLLYAKPCSEQEGIWFGGDSCYGFPRQTDLEKVLLKLSLTGS